MANQGLEPVVDIYTDGACSRNPGPGGWGAVLRYGTQEKELYGGEAADTTNNRMELMAAIQALEGLKRPMVVRLHTDSTYVRDGITKWVTSWKCNGWQTAGKKPVKNVDLWQRLETATNRHQVQWHWVKGHAGHPGNERADRLAAKGLREAMDTRPFPGAGAASSPTQHEPLAIPGLTNEATQTARRCSAPTRGGKPCPTHACPSGLCHVHDPEVQCGTGKRNGQRCTVAMSGGPCEVHRNAEGSASTLF